VKKTVSPPVPSPVVPKPDAARVVQEEPVPEPVPVSRGALTKEPLPAEEIDPGLWENDEPGPEDETPGPEPEPEYEPEPEPEYEPEPEPEAEPEYEPDEPDEPEEPGAAPEHAPIDELFPTLPPEEPVAPKTSKSRAKSASLPRAGKAEPRPATKPRGTISKKTMMAVGVVLAILIIAIAAYAMMPSLKSFGKVAPAVVTPAPATTAVTVKPTPSATPVVTTGPPAPAVTIMSTAPTPVSGDVTGAEQALPPQYTLYFNVDKNSVTGDVTVSATGPSRNVVKDIEVKLTRADGEVVTDHLLPSQGMTDVTLTGTQNPERVEVTVLFYSGEQYKVIDRIVSYSRWR
jgi:hypothetical protein